MKSKSYDLGGATLHAGDCVAILPTLGPVDAIVTDPPYHLTSGNLAVDWAAFGPRTDGGGGSDRGPTNGSGLKAGFMGKAWDGGDIAFRPETWAAIGAPLKPGGYLLAFGGSRTHHRLWCAIEDAGFVIQDTIMWLTGQGFPKGRTQLKPAHEPICVAYKPGGTRTLNIDECRVPTDEALAIYRSFNSGSNGGNAGWQRPWNTTGAQHLATVNTEGRWPANVCHDGSDEVMEAFAAFGNRPSGSGEKNTGSNWWQGPFKPVPGQSTGGDTGTAARFYYCAKASKADRAGSKHPTVKPIALMRWLVRLVTPPGGTVLDPFAGSGTTGAAAIAEGRNAILIEREPEYIGDIRVRAKRGARRAD